MVRSYEQEHIAQYNQVQPYIATVQQNRLRQLVAERAAKKEQRQLERELQQQQQQQRQLQQRQLSQPRQLQQRQLPGQQSQQLGRGSPQMAGIPTQRMGQPPPQLQERPSGDIADENILMRGLELLARPGRSVASGAGYALQGRNPLEGVSAGLSGQGVQDWQEVLKQQGMEEGPGWDSPLGKVTGRGVLGFGLDVLTDPLTLLPVGKGAGLIGRLAGSRGSAVATGIATTGQRISNATDVGAAAKSLKAGKIGKALGRVPVVGAALSRISPTTFPSGLARGMYKDKERLKEIMAGFDALNLNRSSVVEGLMARFVREGRAITNKIDGDGRFLLLDGSKVAWTDVFSNPKKYEKFLTPEEKGWGRDVSRIMGEFWDETKKAKLSKDNMDYVLREGEQFIPRITKKELEEFVETSVSGPKGIGERAYQISRKYRSGEDAIKGGYKLADPLETMKVRMTQMLDHITVSRMAKELEPFATRLDTIQVKQLGHVVEKSLNKENEFKKFGDLVSRIRGGEVSPKGRFATESIEKYTQKASRFDHADLVSQLKEAVQADLRTNVGKAKFKDVVEATAKRARRLKNEADVARRKLNKTRKSLIAGKEEVFGIQRGRRTPFFREARRGEKSDKALEGMWFEPGAAKELTKFFSQADSRTLQALKPLEDISALSRTLTTTLDFAAPFIQGLPLLATNPVAWVKALFRSYTAFFNPIKHQEFLALPRSQRVLSELPGLAVSTGKEEFYKSTARGGLLRRGTEALPGGPKIMEEGVGRFAAAFDAFGDAARIYSGEALLPLARKSGEGRKLAEFLNKMTGAHATPGLSMVQRRAEASMLLFAPRYTRSSIALAFDILGTGTANREAQYGIASMLTAGIAMYTKITRMLGHEPNLDPTDSRFLTIPVGSDVVGVGSVWVAMARLLSRSLTDPGNLVDASELDGNHIVRFWRSRGSPVGSSIVDTVLFNESYIGEPLDSPMQLGKYTSGKLLPFVLESHLLQSPKTDLDWGNVIAELGGMKVVPQRYSERRENLAQEKFGGRSYDELDPYEQVELSKIPELEGFPAPAGERGEKLRRSTFAFESRSEQLDQFAEYVESGQWPKEKFREEAGKVSQELGTRLGDIETEFPRQERDLFGKEKARKEYNDLFRTEFVWEEIPFEEAEQYFASLPKEFQDYIEDKQKASYGRLTPRAERLMLELWEARRTLQEYWGLRDEALERLGIRDKWDQMNLRQQEEFAASNRRYKAASQIWTRRRRALKGRNPKVRKALIEWYGHRR